MSSWPRARRPDTFEMSDPGVRLLRIGAIVEQVSWRWLACVAVVATSDGPAVIRAMSPASGACFPRWSKQPREPLA